MVMPGKPTRSELAEAEGWFPYWETVGTRERDGEERHAAQLLHAEYDRRGAEIEQLRTQVRPSRADRT